MSEDHDVSFEKSLARLHKRLEPELEKIDKADEKRDSDEATDKKSEKE